MFDENLVTRNKTKRTTFINCFGLPGYGKNTFTTRLQKWCNNKNSIVEMCRVIFRYKEDGSYKFDLGKE